MPSRDLVVQNEELRQQVEAQAGRLQEARDMTQAMVQYGE